MLAVLDPVSVVLNSVTLGLAADNVPVTPDSQYHRLNVWWDWFGDRDDRVALMLRPRIALALLRLEPHLTNPS